MLRGMLKSATMPSTNGLWYVAVHIVILLIIRRIQTSSPLRMKHKIKWFSILDIMLLAILEPTASILYWLGWCLWCSWWYFFDMKMYIPASVVGFVEVCIKTLWLYKTNVWVYSPSVLFALGYTYISLYRLLGI